MEDQDINGMLESIIDSLIDKSDDEIKSILSNPEYGLDQEWQDDILEMVHNAQGDTQGEDVQAADALADANAEDFSDNAEADAQDMADEDSTPVSVTEEDSDGDGDTDKTTVEKEEPEDDSNESKDNSDESEDKPHDSKVTSDVRMKNIDNSTNSIAKTLANYRW